MTFSDNFLIRPQVRGVYLATVLLSDSLRTTTAIILATFPVAQSMFAASHSYNSASPDPR